ncbi:MAG: site-2 protease family protein, partial [Clostridiales bacterium]|nr:site-2 protease family protein [Clostridiales bacterium]
MLLTAFAGPASNIILCFISVGLYFLLPYRFFNTMIGSWFSIFLYYLIWINASLAFFNLIPVPPLDGSKILFGLLPDRLYYATQYIERYGSFLLIMLVASRIPDMILGPLTSGLITSFDMFFGLFH